MSPSAGVDGLLDMNEADFDFNLRFEQLILSIIPSAIFILSASWRIIRQFRKPTIVHALDFHLTKIGAIVIYSGLELSLLVLLTANFYPNTSISIPSAALRLISALLMIALSSLDHRKSSKPSMLMSGYFFITPLLDAVQARTLFLSSTNKHEYAYSCVFTTTVVYKLLVLLLESHKKSRWLVWDKIEHSPEELCGIFSLGVYFWLNKIFLEGYAKVLNMGDLYPLDTNLRGKALHDRFVTHIDYSKLQADKFGLLKALIRTLRIPLLLPVLPRLTLLGFTFCQPLFIQSLLDHLSTPSRDPNAGYGLIGASLLIYSGIAVSMAICWYFHHRMRAMMRSILIVEIYRKATVARIDTSRDSAALTLMGTDMERINFGLRSLHDIWACLIQVILASWMLYSQLGASLFAPIALILVCFAGLGFLMRFTGDSQRAWMAGVQQRVGLTATVIASMKSLKLSGLSQIARDLMQKLRVDELAAGAQFRKIGILAAFFGFIPFLIGPPLMFAVSQQEMNTTKIYTSLSYLLLLTTPLTQTFQNIPEILSGLACLGRVQDFLQEADRKGALDLAANPGHDSEKRPEPSSNHPTVRELQSIRIQHGTFGWQPATPALQDINALVRAGSITTVVGPVGSGKSTLCQAILGEVPFKDGRMLFDVQPRHIGYCHQTSFLSNETIRHNIVGFSSFDPVRYAEVIEAAALAVDLRTLPQGDRTKVGSDGITLSGGQKQRIALARALYVQTNLLVLDDIFSGLDADTEDRITQQVFGPNGLLRRRKVTTILCTHSSKQLEMADHIIALQEGQIIEQGSLRDLFAASGYVRDLMSGDGVADASPSTDTTAREEKSQPIEYDSTSSHEPGTPKASSDHSASRQNGDWTVYKQYFKSMGLVVASSSFGFAVLWGVFTNLSTVWLKFWSDDAFLVRPTHSFAWYAGIYALIQCCALISLLLLAVFLYVISIKKTGTILHWAILSTLVQAPLSFFVATDTGVVTNLFSQDLNLVDTELPMALLNTLINATQAIGQAAVMLTASPYMAISYPFLVALLWVVQKFYLRTSRQLRLLDLEAKSPLYSHFIDTVRGIVTLRAFAFIPEEIEKNSLLVDDSQRAGYLLVMIQQWLNFVLDVVVTILAALMTTLAVRLHSNAGFTGASMVSLMSFGENLSGIVIAYTKLETSLGAISRLKTFQESVLPEDQDGEDVFPARHWPSNGAIELRDVCASYEAPTPWTDSPKLALSHIDLFISAGEKVAICGRTGSGKSTLIALLLKLLDPLSGTVVIDETLLSGIDRSTLRQRIIAMPQEAVFLPDGTSFHVNLDPSGASMIAECEAVLATVGLLAFVQERGGLTASMEAGTLSAGQRQLMSLGRVLVRRRIRARSMNPNVTEEEGGILVLDEVSSNVDQDTERVMQDIISAEFKRYTVIAVSHRLNMILDFDRVVVMEEGKIVETGNPAVLRRQETSRFGGLLRAGGY